MKRIIYESNADPQSENEEEKERRDRRSNYFNDEKVSIVVTRTHDSLIHVSY